MPTPRPRPYVLSLALVLFGPAALAQTPPKAVPTQVRLQVGFFPASATDVDNLGVNFDLTPLSTPAANIPPKEMHLQSLVGGVAPQLYQTLTRTHGCVVQTILVIPTGLPATVSVNALTVYYPNRVSFSPFGGDPRLQETKPLTVQAALSITPHINRDGSVTLTLTPQVGDLNATPTGPRATLSRTVPGGEMLVLSGLPTGKGAPVGDQELLIFVTPTVITPR